jgi:hypothetical protein
MPDRFRITKGWAQRFAAEKISVPQLLRRAGLPANLFEQEKIYVTTAEVFAIWRTVAEMSSDPAFGLKLGTEIRFERSHPVSIAGVCSRTFGDALQRLARYKQLTCPEEIRVYRKGQETSVEFFFVEAREAQPGIMVDLGLSWILCVGRRGSDGEITPLRLELTRPAKHRAMLERHFGCRVRFNADRDALVFRSSDLDLPFVTQNEELAQIIGTQCLDESTPEARFDVYLEIAYNPEDFPYSPDIGLSFAPNTYDKAARPTGIPLWFILCPDTPARSYPSWTFKTEDDLKSVLTRIQADVLDPYAKPLWLECDRLKQCIGSFRAQFRQ